MEFPVEVLGNTYKSKTEMQREWRQVVGEFPSTGKRKHSPTGGTMPKSRVYVSDQAREWFIRVAMLSPKHRAKVFYKGRPFTECSKWPSLQQGVQSEEVIKQVIASTLVFIDKADTGCSIKGFSMRNNNAVIKAPFKQMARQRSVFFQNIQLPHMFKTIPSTFENKAKPSKANVPRNDLTRLLRQAIQPQIDSFRKECKAEAKFGKYVCNLCQKPLGRKENHVDHGVGAASFKCISQDFIDLYPKLYQGTPSVENMQSGPALDYWQRFHRMRANLKMTCKQCNLTNK